MWSTEQRCIHIEITCNKISSLAAFTVWISSHSDLMSKLYCLPYIQIFFLIIGFLIALSSKWRLCCMCSAQSTVLRFFKTCTGSTIRFWHKVKTWLDQMFWQIYQKLMLSGFLSSGNLCLIHHLKLFWPHAASTASNKKGAKTQHEFSQFFFLQNIKRKWCYSSNLLNSRTWKPLKSSVVIFQALETSSALLTSVASATSLASTAYKAQLPT